MINNAEKRQVGVSVLIPISEARHDDLTRVFNSHKDILEDLELSYEFIFVLKFHRNYTM